MDSSSLVNIKWVHWYNRVSSPYPASSNNPPKGAGVSQSTNYIISSATKWNLPADGCWHTMQIPEWCSPKSCLCFNGITDPQSQSEIGAICWGATNCGYLSSRCGAVVLDAYTPHLIHKSIQSGWRGSSIRWSSGESLPSVSGINFWRRSPCITSRL